MATLLIVSAAWAQQATFHKQATVHKPYAAPEVTKTTGLTLAPAAPRAAQDQDEVLYPDARQTVVKEVLYSLTGAEAVFYAAPPIGRSSASADRLPEWLDDLSVLLEARDALQAATRYETEHLTLRVMPLQLRCAMKITF